MLLSIKLKFVYVDVFCLKVTLRVLQYNMAVSGFDLEKTLLSASLTKEHKFDGLKNTSELNDTVKDIFNGCTSELIINSVQGRTSRRKKMYNECIPAQHFRYIKKFRNSVNKLYYYDLISNLYLIYH